VGSSDYYYNKIYLPLPDILLFFRCFELKNYT
jgi:hypothetical protein